MIFRVLFVAGKAEVIYMNIKTDGCFDLVALGEVMLRFDPGENRVRNARSFTVWEGGGEYNVARALSKCFRMKTAVATALCENDIGFLVEDLIMQGGVDTSLIQWKPFDKIGKSCRNGLNFVERGFGLRGAKGTSDRGNTAVSQIKEGDFDWDSLFSKGVRVFHTGGIFCALSASTAKAALEAARKAKEHGTFVSFDFNFRPSLWACLENAEEVRKTIGEILRYTDVVFGNEFDFVNVLGFESEKGADLDVHDDDRYLRFMNKVGEEYPNIKLIATTVRTVHSASCNSLRAVCVSDKKLVLSGSFEKLDVLDRIGSGDSFASGFLFSLLSGKDVESALSFALANAAFAMTTPGDTSMATEADIENIVSKKTAKVVR